MSPEMRERAREALRLIRRDIESDVEATEGMEFTGRNVATALGNLAAQVDAIAGIVQALIEDPA